MHKNNTLIIYIDKNVLVFLKTFEICNSLNIPINIAVLFVSDKHVNTYLNNKVDFV